MKHLPAGVAEVVSMKHDKASSMNPKKIRF